MIYIYTVDHLRNFFSLHLDSRVWLHQVAQEGLWILQLLAHEEEPRSL